MKISRRDFLKALASGAAAAAVGVPACSEPTTARAIIGSATFRPGDVITISGIDHTFIVDGLITPAKLAVESLQLLSSQCRLGDDCPPAHIELKLATE